ncbi:hypothetical protein F4860DRAFT_519317 [Xylaria cubensis]|nr:hypothetical protein F4860DRAFT_519317 [Xylaria cubensis]
MDAIQSRPPVSYDSEDDPPVNAPLSNGARYEKECRERVNRVLALEARDVTAYELLDVAPDAPLPQIKKQWKTLMNGIRRNKNRKDESAVICAQTKNRDACDRSLVDFSPPVIVESFDEVFGPNAWESDGHESVVDDGKSKKEADYPLPGLHVRNLHEKMTPFIKYLFKDTYNLVLDSAALDEVNKLNTEIENYNIEQRQQRFLHQFPQDLIQYFHAQRIAIIRNVETDDLHPARVREEVSKLQDFFEREGSRYTWPASWTGLLTDPLDQRFGLSMPSQTSIQAQISALTNQVSTLTTALQQNQESQRDFMKTLIHLISEQLA